MYRLGVSKQEPGCIAKAARYYKECAYAATCAPVDGNQGEKALRSCVEMYMYNQDTDSAEEVLKIYAKRMGKAVSGWDPAPATKEMIKRHNLVYD